MTAKGGKFKRISGVAALAALPIVFLTYPAAGAPSPPGFDCAKAAGEVELAVCREPRLAALDARLSALYRQDLRLRPADEAEVRRDQAAWLKKRDQACSQAHDPAPCLDGYYRNRIDTQKERNEVAAHPPPAGDYAHFIGRWRVEGVRAAADAGDVVDFSDDDPRYMGLVLSAEAQRVRWLNGSTEDLTDPRCPQPRFATRTSSSDLPPGWKAVSLACDGNDWDFDRLTLKASDLAELGSSDYGILLELKRVPYDAPVPPPPPSEGPKPPPLPSDDSNSVTARDRAFFRQLRLAILRRDRRWLAAHVSDGLGVNRDNGASYAYTPAQILEVYDWIVTPEVENAVRRQRADDLWKNWRGVMIGRGQVWFDQVATGKTWTYAVITINQNAPSDP